MTNTIIIGNSVPPAENFIQFTHVLVEDLTLIPATNAKPSSYKYIELVCLNYGQGKDMMFAYDSPNRRSHGVLHLGHWNSGVANDK